MLLSKNERDEDEDDEEEVLSQHSKIYNNPHLQSSVRRIIIVGDDSDDHPDN